jgi:hypothetical protein
VKIPIWIRSRLGRVTVAVQKKKSEIELEPDAWERFERAVAVVSKSPPQHRTKLEKIPAKKKKQKKRRL